MKLLNKGKTKYVKLMMEHISNSNWLTKPQGPLVSLNGFYYAKVLKYTDWCFSATDSGMASTVYGQELLFLYFGLMDGHLLELTYPAIHTYVRVYYNFQ